MCRLWAHPSTDADPHDFVRTRTDNKSKINKICGRELMRILFCDEFFFLITANRLRKFMPCDRLQFVQKAAERLIFKACRQDHIQLLLRRLHWLRMPGRVSFRLAVLLYRCLHGSAPGCLASDLQRVTPQRPSTTALFDYFSAGRSTHCAFYHWRPHLSSNCCIGLEQFARVSLVIAVIASFPQQTENRTFCPVLQT